MNPPLFAYTGFRPATNPKDPRIQHLSKHVLAEDLLSALDLHLKERGGDSHFGDGLERGRAGETPATVRLKMAKLMLGLIKGMLAIHGRTDELVELVCNDAMPVEMLQSQLQTSISPTTENLVRNDEHI